VEAKMLEVIFGSATLEKVLFYILLNNKCYPSELSKTFNVSLSNFQNALDRLEEGGVLVSFMFGKTRLYQFNPRYFFLKELKNLIQKAYDFLPEQFKEKYYEKKIRKRPRKRKKYYEKNKF
jgi:DNA-binding MarR family transcriptional regulator